MTRYLDLPALVHIIGPRFAEGADARDATDTFVDAHYDVLKEHKVFSAMVPKDLGGGGIGHGAMCAFLRDLAHYCSSTALALSMHQHLVAAAVYNHRNGRPGQKLLERVAASETVLVSTGAADWMESNGSVERVEGGFRVNGKKIFASLSGAADYYGILCTLREPNDKPSRRNTLYLAVPANAKGVTVTGEWDPLGMRGTVSRTLLFRDVFVPEESMLMPKGIYFEAASRWPHMFMTLTPTYMGLAQASYDFTVAYLRGEEAGTPPVKRRMYPTKQIALAEMRVMLEQTKALWFQAITEARANPSRDQVQRAWAAQYTVMENANALAAKAVRTCGGQSMMKSLRLERIYRDSRCGSLMLPWTAEICIDRLGRDCLYNPGETDE